MKEANQHPIIQHTRSLAEALASLQNKAKELAQGTVWLMWWTFSARGDHKLVYGCGALLGGHAQKQQKIKIRNQRAKMCQPNS